MATECGPIAVVPTHPLIRPPNLAAPPSKYDTLARLQGEVRRLVVCGSGGNSARGRRGAELQGGRARERERVRPAPPRAPPLPPPHNRSRA